MKTGDDLKINGFKMHLVLILELSPRPLVQERELRHNAEVMIKYGETNRREKSIDLYGDWGCKANVVHLT